MTGKPWTLENVQGGLTLEHFGDTPEEQLARLRRNLATTERRIGIGSRTSREFSNAFASELRALIAEVGAHPTDARPGDARRVTAVLQSAH